MRSISSWKFQVRLKLLATLEFNLPIWLLSFEKLLAGYHHHLFFHRRRLVPRPFRSFILRFFLQL